jgi:hypothetical protein
MNLGHQVKEVLAREDRNDQFMKTILDKTNNMEQSKVETTKYALDWEEIH